MPHFHTRVVTCSLLQTPIGIITKLLVSMRRNQLITHVTNATDVHVWNVDAALRQLPVLDRLTDAVQELQVTRRDTMVFVKCQNSDEVGVIDMRTGTLLDLLTHETKVGCLVCGMGLFSIMRQ